MTQRTGFFDDLYESFLKLPAWVGPVAALFIFVCFRWLLPLMLSSGPSATGLDIGKATSSLLPIAGNVLAGFILFVWSLAELQKFLNRKMLDKQTGQSSIRRLSWDRFEELISELYRRQGFEVSHSGGNGPDGGIDQRIRKAGEYALVQCKHWRSERVGVKVARELLGVVTSEKADYGVLITSGTFTDEAIAFARKNPLELINGEKLMALLEPIQEGSPPKTEEEFTPICPACGCLMLRKTARRGPNPGTMFWGCPNYTCQ